MCLEGLKKVQFEGPPSCYELEKLLKKGSIPSLSFILVDLDLWQNEVLNESANIGVGTSCRGPSVVSRQ